MLYYCEDGVKGLASCTYIPPWTASAECILRAQHCQMLCQLTQLHQRYHAAAVAGGFVAYVAFQPEMLAGFAVVLLHCPCSMIMKV